MDDNVSDVRRRLAVLRTRLTPAPAAQAPASDPGALRVRQAAIGLAVGAIVLAGAATGAYLSAWSGYQHEVKLCTSMPCTPSDYPSLTDRVRTAQIAGYTLWTLAGVVAIADVALWVVAAKQASTTHAFLRGRPGLGLRF